MKIWMRLGVGVAAIALSVGLGVGAYAMYGDDSAPKQRSIADAPETGDEDASAGGGGGLAATCLVGTVDCNDTPGIEYDDFGDAAKCAAEATNCIEPAACPPEDCSTMSYGSCELETAEDGSTVETCVACTPAYPVPEPMIEPAPGGVAIDEPAPVLDPAVSGPAIDVTDPPDFDPGMVGTGCLGLDPCTVSARPLCVSGDCTVSSDGVIECPYIAPCDIEELLPGETEVKPIIADLPCAVSPCFGNDPLAGVPENCPSDPCTIYSPSEPAGVPCNHFEPCTIPDPAANVPESGTETCPPPPAGGSSGSSGSGSSGEGSTTDAVLPAAE